MRGHGEDGYAGAMNLPLLALGTLRRFAYEKVDVGQVYTLEPRAFCKGHGVATVEEIVVVRPKGCEFLSKRQQELICIG